MPAIDIILTGPIFSPIVGRVFPQAVTRTVRALMSFGERSVKLQLYPGHGVITGHYRRSVRSTLTSSKHGIIHDSKVVYGPTLEGGRKGTRFKGYHQFRNARQAVERRKIPFLRKEVARAVGVLNG